MGSLDKAAETAHTVGAPRPEDAIAARYLPVLSKVSNPYTDP